MYKFTVVADKSFDDLTYISLPLTYACTLVGASTTDVPLIVLVLDDAPKYVVKGVV